MSGRSEFFRFFSPLDLDPSFVPFRFFQLLTPPRSRSISLFLTPKQDVEGLGEAGAEHLVRPGFARNSLLPRGAAELVPHRRARRESRPPRSVLEVQRLESEREEVAKKRALAAEAGATADETAAAAAAPDESDETSPSRLVAVARSLSKGALEFVRPLKQQPSAEGGGGDQPSFSPSSSDKIAEPIDAEAFAAAVAAQKRISLDPRLVVLEKPIDEQGEHFVELRMRVGGERVVVRALVGLAAASGGGGDEKKGGKKKGGKR